MTSFKWDSSKSIIVILTDYKAWVEEQISSLQKEEKKIQYMIEKESEIEKEIEANK